MIKQKNNIPSGSDNIFFTIRYPYLWLLLAALLVYLHTLNFKFTHLDDKIFIIDKQEFMSSLSNFPKIFSQGVFHASKDIYYRPLLIASFMIDHQAGGTFPKYYHFINILLHLACCALLYLLLLRLNFTRTKAFVFTLLFAVHPVLSQVVAWIPGRNDSLLFLFVVSSFLFFLKYSSTGKTKYLLFHILLWMGGLLTKETAAFLPLAILAYVVLIEKRKPFTKTHLLTALLWALTGISWLVLRASYTISPFKSPGEIVSSFFNRLPVLVQYLGKIFLPFNLSVFPIMQDTTYVYGIISLALLAALVFMNRRKIRYSWFFFGLLWFFFFLFSALIVPQNINDQVFEHRLYLPFIGILIMLNEVIHLNDKPLFYVGTAVALVLALLNYNHSRDFRNELVFWKSAVDSSPHSAYAHTLYAIKLYNADRKEEAEKQLDASLKLSQEERYTHHFKGLLAMEKGKPAEAEKYFREEIKVNPDFEPNYFELAHASIMQNKKDSAIYFLQKSIALNPQNFQAHNNLMIAYMEKGEYDKALQKALFLKEHDQLTTPEILEELKAKMK